MLSDVYCSLLHELKEREEFLEKVKREGEDLLEEARTRKIRWERQDEVENSQKVRVWGDTAVVTAKLWVKGTVGGKAFDKKLWFSDTYVRTAGGWRYAFGQASINLPQE